MRVQGTICFSLNTLNQRRRVTWPTPWGSLATPNSTHDITWAASSTPAHVKSPPNNGVLMINICDLDDTDAFFLLEEFPAPRTIVTATGRMLPVAVSTTNSRMRVKCEGRKAMAVFADAAWECLSNGHVLDEVLHHSPHPQHLPFGAGASSGAVSNWFLSETLSNIQEDAARVTSEVHQCVRSSMQLQAQVILRGRTRRPLCPLWVSLQTARSMRLSIAPQPKNFTLSSRASVGAAGGHRVEALNHEVDVRDILSPTLLSSVNTFSSPEKSLSRHGHDTTVLSSQASEKSLCAEELLRFSSLPQPAVERS